MNNLEATRQQPGWLADKAITFGLRGPGARALMPGSDYSDRDDTNIASSLVRRWAAIAVSEVKTAREEYAASQESLGAAESATLSAASRAWDIKSLQMAYSLKGEHCIRNIVVNAFIDRIHDNLLDAAAQLDVQAGQPPPAESLQSPTKFPSKQFTPPSLEPVADAQEGSSTTLRAIYMRKKAEACVNLAQHFETIRASTDLRFPQLEYPIARSMTRTFHLHVGPTNSGKTHGALKALCSARNGAYCGPLRMLAHEVWDRINQGTVSPGVAARPCNLVTGEERRTVRDASLTACTVEMLSFDDLIDVAVIDEIQMIADTTRGSAWTSAVLGVPAKEVHLCGEASVVSLIERIAASCGDKVEVHRYDRLSPLRVSDKSLTNDLQNIKKGDCVVSFSRSGLFSLKEKIEQTTGLRCAIAYGALPPETKAEQARMFNDPDSDLDVMVASDAIGMGLNLKIKRIVFESLHKWNGKETVSLSGSQIKQIAGRAGRYGTGAPGEEAGGEVTTMEEIDLPILRKALAAPLLPIERAVLGPTNDAVAALSTLMGVPQTGIYANQLYSGIRPDEAGREDSQVWRAYVSPTQYPMSENTVVNFNSTEEQKLLDADLTKTYKKSAGHAILDCEVYDITQGVPSLSQLFTAFKDLARVDTSTYYLAGEAEENILADMIEEATRGFAIPILDKFSISRAPVNSRDERVLTFARNLVRGFGRGGLVSVAEGEQGLDMLEALDNAEGCQRRAEEVVARISAKGSEDKRTLPSAAHMEPPGLDVNSLQLLESLHRCVTLYSWLHFRFPLAFPYAEQTLEIKIRTENAIAWTLEAIKYARSRRLAALEKKREQDRKSDAVAGGQTGSFQRSGQRRDDFASRRFPRGRRDDFGPRESSSPYREKWV
ncbi:p-loop containing nucleoside triphosphate hydrolase protein [Ceraceosorus bombacis]|uniref:RNA helicase n=1 Tax=Ceraceosorus bombacis TaxID=401625 RepID=A0A0N7L955_9BASI|nr:p-loop containing nucleoside triphosphate hydrolase protein [Ceraceosorus bombacis]